MSKPSRVVILAAGTGSRLMPLTADRPKCMVELGDRALLERQLAAMRSLGLEDVTLIAGHGAGSIRAPGVRVVVNARYETTNMVESLFCAQGMLDGQADVIVSYGDIVYERAVLRRLLEASSPLSVCVDVAWRRYWSLRMPDPLCDAETLKLSADDRIVELGRKPSGYEDIQGQYIGLFKIRADTAPEVLRFYQSLDRGARYDGKPFERMFMTSFLQALIDAGFEVRPVRISNGWLEIDTPADLDLYSKLLGEGRLKDLYDDLR